MIESDILDLTPDTLGVFFTHGDRKKLERHLSELVLSRLKSLKIVDDVEDAIAGYKEKFGVPAPNPLLVMFMPDQYTIKDPGLEIALDSIDPEPPINELV